MTKPELLCEDTWAIEDAGVRIFILKGKDKTIVIDIPLPVICVCSQYENN